MTILAGEVFAGALNFATGSISKAHLGPDGKPEMLDSVKESDSSVWQWVKSNILALPAEAKGLPANAAGRQFLGRDPRSPGPQSGLAYTPPAVPVNVSANLQGAATVNVENHVNVTGLVETIMSKIEGRITGMFKSMGAAGTNGPSGVDGRQSAVYPDHFHGGGH
jgi:hypothetical protein